MTLGAPWRGLPAAVALAVACVGAMSPLSMHGAWNLGMVPGCAVVLGLLAWAPTRWLGLLGFFSLVALGASAFRDPWLVGVVGLGLAALTVRWRTPAMAVLIALVLALAPVLVILGESGLRLWAALSGACWAGLGLHAALNFLPPVSTGDPAWPAALLRRATFSLPVDAARLELLHGVVLVVFAVALSLGEGIAFAAGGLLVLAIVARHSDVQWNVLELRSVRGIACGALLWIGAGLVASVLEAQWNPREWGMWAPLLVLPVILLTVASLPRRYVRWAGTAFFVGLALSSLFGVCQYVADASADAWWLRPFAAASSLWQAHVPGARRLVAGGFYMHRLKLAHVLVLGLCVLGARQLACDLRWRARVIECSAITLMLAALVLTYTRAAMVGLGAATLVGLWCAPRRLRLGVAGVVVLVGALVVSHAGTRARLASSLAQGALSDRATMWAASVQMIDDHPMGLGLGLYPVRAPAYYDAAAPGHQLPRTYAHHWILSAWAETGPLGACGYALIWVSFGWACLRLLRRPQHRVLGLGGLMALAAFWTIGLSHDVLYHKPVALVFASLVGGILGASARSTVRTRGRAAIPHSPR